MNKNTLNYQSNRQTYDDQEYKPPIGTAGNPRNGRKSSTARYATTEYRALGLNSRGLARGIAIVGLLFSPILIGVPLIVWGLAANHMLHKHEKSMDEINAHS